HLGGVADQGRQEAGGAVAAVRAADGVDRLGTGVVVEQHAAATVDLHVDEARQQPAAAEVAHLAGLDPRLALGHQRLDAAAAVDQHRHVVMEAVVQQDAAVHQGLGGHHTVSVTLLRCGGTSGLCPRRSASASTARYKLCTASSGASAGSGAAASGSAVPAPPALASAAASQTCAPRAWNCAAAEPASAPVASGWAKASTGKPGPTNAIGPCRTSAEL